MPDSSSMTLKLEPILGPVIDPIVVHGDGAVTIGRGADCEIKLPEVERTVSRRHCAVQRMVDCWILRDLASRHGTFLNNEQLEPNAERRLNRGDKLRIGPWTFRVTDPTDTSMTTLMVDEAPSIGDSVQTLTQVRRDSIHRRRLELLLECAKRLHAAEDEAQLAEQVLDLVLDGTGYSLVSLVRPIEQGERVEVVGTRSRRRQTEAVTYSRNLTRAACRGSMVQLNQPGMGPTQTIMGAGIHSALCVPVIHDKLVALCLYLDARQSDPPVHDDAAAFCQAVAELCGLALANLRRVRLEQEQVRTDERMQAAMDIQRGAMPATVGELGPVRYAVSVFPAREVAGDLFDIFMLDEHRVALFMGDVAGKGVGAALLGAMTQAYLSAALRHHGFPAAALDDVNRHLVAKAADDKFVSAWCGVLDLETRELVYVDAGHGYWLVRDAAGDIQAMADPAQGGLPLRAAPWPYQNERLVLSPESRLLLYSDGVVEQPDPTGVQFGPERVLSVLSDAGCLPPKAEVVKIVEAVRKHAGSRGSEGLADDLSVASIVIG